MTAAIYCLTRGTSGWGHTTRPLIESDQGLTQVFAPSGYLYSPPSFSFTVLGNDTEVRIGSTYGQEESGRE
jgi:hypothetical protein